MAYVFVGLGVGVGGFRNRDIMVARRNRRIGIHARFIDRSAFMRFVATRMQILIFRFLIDIDNKMFVFEKECIKMEASKPKEIAASNYTHQQ